MRFRVAACSHDAELGLSSQDALAWAHGVPAFVEIFDGEGGLSLAIATGGWSVAPGIDRRRPTYGVSWHLDCEQDRSRLRYLLFEVLRPGGRIVHSRVTHGRRSGSIHQMRQR